MYTTHSVFFGQQDMAGQYMAESCEKAHAMVVPTTNLAILSARLENEPTFPEATVLRTGNLYGVSSFEELPALLSNTLF